MRLMLLALSLVPLLLGCGGGMATVSGQVRFQGKPLPGGTVTFRPANPNHNPVTVGLDEEGNYEARLPMGEVEVAVDNRELRPRSSAPIRQSARLPKEVRDAMSKAKAPKDPPPAMTASAPPTPRGKYIAIPEKYYTIEKSGLKFTVERGNQKHDVELK